LCHFSDEVLNNSSERSEESVNVSKTILKHTSPDASFVSMTLSYGGWLMADGDGDGTPPNARRGLSLQASLKL
ncbi:MAG: hypothetical protein J6K05_04115, partial [Bacteroidaceae bacterium]|nr:hypothetical protein [Bacteroidaceae bacterium]